MKKEISTTNAPYAIGPYSQGVKIGNMVFVSGQLPIDPQTGKFPDDDIAVLTRRSLDNISAVLYEAGMTMRDVVKTTIFLVDMNDSSRLLTRYMQAISTMLRRRVPPLQWPNCQKEHA